MTQSARDALILEHLPRVSKLAGAMRAKLPSQVLMEDLVQAGAVGLIEAADKFDSARGVPFWGYAERRVRGAMQDWQRGEDPLSRGERKLQREEKGEPVKTISMSRLTRPGEDGKDLDIPDARNPPDASTGQRESHAILLREIEALPAKAQTMVILYYFADLTMKQIAQRLGVGESRISQMHSQALDKLQSHLSERKLTLAALA